jgi:hypothetical protein
MKNQTNTANWKKEYAAYIAEEKEAGNKITAKVRQEARAWADANTEPVDAMALPSDSGTYGTM